MNIEQTFSYFYTDAKQCAIKHLLLLKGYNSDQVLANKNLTKSNKMIRAVRLERLFFDVPRMHLSFSIGIGMEPLIRQEITILILPFNFPIISNHVAFLYFTNGQKQKQEIQYSFIRQNHVWNTISFGFSNTLFLKNKTIFLRSPDEIKSSDVDCINHHGKPSRASASFLLASPSLFLSPLLFLLSCLLFFCLLFFSFV